MEKLNPDSLHSIFFHILRVIRFGWKNLWLHKLRSFLTILGIVFGVSSVIAMLAIGEGASYQVREEIRKLGSHNIIIKAVKPPPLPQQQQGNWETLNIYGLTPLDLSRISTIPSVESVMPTWETNEFAWNYEKSVRARIVGALPGYAEAVNLTVSEGRFFNEFDLDSDKHVAVIGSSVKGTICPGQDPVGKTIKIKGFYFTIIGVINEKAIAISNSEFSAEDINFDVYIPLTTMKMFFGEYNKENNTGSEVSLVKYHRFVVKVWDAEKILGTASLIDRVLLSTHKNPDYQMLVPLQLLQQEEHRKRIFSIVLGSIAAISLLVGGIGIMNIMLATVTERTREIGIRRALGAKRSDIIHQFLGETVILSSTGGVIGIILGIIIPKTVTHFSGMATIITLWSVLFAFSISVAVGVAFGIYPARKASLLDPIEALRYE